MDTDSPPKFTYQKGNATLCCKKGSSHTAGTTPEVTQTSIALECEKSLPTTKAIPHTIPPKPPGVCTHAECRRRLALTQIIAGTCRCQGVFCPQHRLPEHHTCPYNYRESGRAELERNNPKVIRDRIERF